MWSHSPRPERLSVCDAFGQLTDTHEGTRLLDAMQDLGLFLALFVQLGHFVGCSGEEG